MDIQKSGIMVRKLIRHFLSLGVNIIVSLSLSLSLSGGVEVFYLILTSILLCYQIGT
jgi:hypothetical protein